jgi:hypothetical protein
VSVSMSLSLPYSGSGAPIEPSSDYTDLKNHRYGPLVHA